MTTSVAKTVVHWTRPAWAPDVPLAKPKFGTVAELNPESRGENLVVKVVEIKEVSQQGETSRVVEALVGDTTGCIVLAARDEQLGEVKAGATLVLRNTRVDMVNNHMTLVVPQPWGVLKASATPLSGEVNTGNNLSAVEYELTFGEGEGEGEGEEEGGEGEEQTEGA